MATNAERLAELETELASIKAAQAKALTGVASTSVGGVSVSFSSPAALQERRVQIEKSIQRLVRGGRGLPIDMGATPYV